ncbi:uncharacterized protein TNCV_4642521 [Trichonephila clavipes]|nr:uncharacterized protein TNCV_4642521 [Trichonephila clavipes]
MAAAIPNVLQLGVFVRFEKTQEPLMKVLPVPGWRPMKQLAVRVHYLRCGGLLNDWSVEDGLRGGGPELGLRVNDISQIHWSQYLLTMQSEWPN